MILKQNQEAEAIKRRKLKKKIIRHYEAQTVKNLNDKDLLYNRVMVNMDRLLKVLTGHSQAIDSLERKLNTISAKRKKQALKALERNKAEDILANDEDDIGNIMDEEERMFNTGEFGLVHGMHHDDDALSKLSEDDMRRD